MRLNSLFNRLNAIANINLLETERNKQHSIEILKHSKNYSDLLDIYINSTRKNLIMKRWFKIIFFVVTMCSLIAIIFFFYTALQYAFKSFDKFDNLNGVTIEAILSIVTLIIPAISSLVVAFVKIPEIIAQYLFSTEEDNNMTTIIKNIQDYDKDMFAMEHKIEELLMNNKDQSAEVEDDIIEDPPTQTENAV